MISSTSSNVASPQALAVTELAQEYGVRCIPWKQLDQSRGDVMERLFDLLRDAGVMGIMFYDDDATEIPFVEVRH